MKRFRVRINVALEKGYNADQAEIDPKHLGEHVYYPVFAKDHEEAERFALDDFHASIPIGVLEGVDIGWSSLEVESTLDKLKIPDLVQVGNLRIEANYLSAEEQQLLDRKNEAWENVKSALLVHAGMDINTRKGHDPSGEAVREVVCEFARACVNVHYAVVGSLRRKPAGNQHALKAMDIDMETAKKLIAEFHAKYPGIRKYTAMVRRELVSFQPSGPAAFPAVPLEVTILKLWSMPDPNEPQMEMVRVEHKKDIDVQDAVKAAFIEWYRTADGKKYVDSNGCNWGDSLDIPDEILKKHGIYEYEQLGNNNDDVQTVNHDDYVFDPEDIKDNGEVDHV